MYAHKLSFDYAHALHTVCIVHNAHSAHRSRVQKGQSCDCINFVRATDAGCGTVHVHGIWKNGIRYYSWYYWYCSSSDADSIDKGDPVIILEDCCYGQSFFYKRKRLKQACIKVPTTGVEPATYSLRMSCSTN